MKKNILGLDLGTNSIGWALFSENDNNQISNLIDMGCRIFNRAIEDKTRIPKNIARRNARLARRVGQRRARRKTQMLNYLISLDLLPELLKQEQCPKKIKKIKKIKKREDILNELGDPYVLRTQALDKALSSHQLGRVFLHLVQRRGFLSNRKTLLGDMVDDPDIEAVLSELNDKDENNNLNNEQKKEETKFKQDIQTLRQSIENSGARTLGEYLCKFHQSPCQRNRESEDGKLRTDRQMYSDEIEYIFKVQKKHHKILTEDVIEKIKKIIFYQRPLKLKPNRVRRCSLEHSCQRVQMGKIEYQRFRYLQDINNLAYFEPYSEKNISLSENDRLKLIDLFEHNQTVTFSKIRITLGLEKGVTFNTNTPNKKLKGNITACKIRQIIDDWNNWDKNKQLDLVEDLITIHKKSVLKNRLTEHWRLPLECVAKLCILELEPGHGNHSMKAIRKILPFLEQGFIYSEARKEAGYDYEEKKIKTEEKLGLPPTIPNPIVQKALHELRRVVNAIIAEYGKPNVIRIEMARDLEMNTKRYKEYEKQQKINTKANDEAKTAWEKAKKDNKHLDLTEYPSRDDKIRYRLWKDQSECCAYSMKMISQATLFSSEIEIDHIIPFSQSHNDSYMNKVICYASENRTKGNRTPKDAFASDENKWTQITQHISQWNSKLKSKKDRFYKSSSDYNEEDFLSSQLSDTRYISREAGQYLKTLGVDITFSKGIIVSNLRHQWDLNRLLGDTPIKSRNDHRHHAIDAAVIACLDRAFYTRLVKHIKEIENSQMENKLSHLYKVQHPYPQFKQQIEKQLNELIVSHTSQRKISGALHEDTGSGFVEFTDKSGKVTQSGEVTRKLLSNLTKKNINMILDPVVKAKVGEHLVQHDNDLKQAFANNTHIMHSNGKTPIKRVRIFRNTLKRKDLKNKFSVSNSQGETFKWMNYGNNHHIEIIRNVKTDKYKGVLITTVEAAYRARGINQNKKPIIQTNYVSPDEFVMALHINDMVTLEQNGGKVIYRVRKLDSAIKPVLILHTVAPSTTASKATNNENEISRAIPSLMRMNMKKINVNAIGKIIT